MKSATRDWLNGLIENNNNSKAIEIRQHIQHLENALWRISDPLGALEKEAGESEMELNGVMAVQIANDASTLKQWASDALNN